VRNWNAAKSLLEQIGVSESQVAIWGSGTPLREFLYVDDLADACIFVMDHVDFEDVVPKGPEKRNTHINVGTGREIAIRDLAGVIRDVVGFQGDFVFDQTKPDGTPRKCLDVSKLTSLGWTPRVGLTQGIERVYRQYLAKAGH
jgi:GDP-L-fucose synthase